MKRKLIFNCKHNTILIVNTFANHLIYVKYHLYMYSKKHKFLEKNHSSLYLFYRERRFYIKKYLPFLSMSYTLEHRIVIYIVCNIYMYSHNRVFLYLFKS